LVTETIISKSTTQNKEYILSLYRLVCNISYINYFYPNTNDQQSTRYCAASKLNQIPSKMPLDGQFSLSVELQSFYRWDPY